jgi:hypothetical protein
MKTIRTIIRPQTRSGNRASWFKLIESVDITKKDGYAFNGDFLKLDQEIELPIGAIVVEKEPVGSVKSGSHEGNIYRVVESPIDDVLNPHLELIEYFEWRKEFLSFRDRVAELLAEVGAAQQEQRINQMVKQSIDQAQASRSTQQTIINQLNEAIDLVLKAKRLTEGMGSPHQAICNCAETLIQGLDLYGKTPAELFPAREVIQ